MWRRPEIALAFLIACRRDPPPIPSTDASAEASALATTTTDASTDASTDRDVIEHDADALSMMAEDEMRRMMGVAPEHVAHVRSIGHTSVVLKIEMHEGQKYAFKPSSKRGPSRWRGEIAAFRLALLLGIRENVPKAYDYTTSRRELTIAAAGDEKMTALLANDVIFDAEMAHGALIPWIDDYAVVPLDKDPLFSQWRGWLKSDGVIPEDQRVLAREVSTLVLFDFVTGNWDRWSGANIASSKGHLLYVDNDGAFFESPPKDGLARSRRYLEMVDRFSKSFVDRLRAVQDDDIKQSMRGVLSDKALEGVFARRKEALAIIEKKELYFP